MMHFFNLLFALLFIGLAILTNFGRGDGRVQIAMVRFNATRPFPMYFKLELYFSQTHMHEILFTWDASEQGIFKNMWHQYGDHFNRILVPGELHGRPPTTFYYRCRLYKSRSLNFSENPDLKFLRKGIWKDLTGWSENNQTFEAHCSETFNAKWTFKLSFNCSRHYFNPLQCVDYCKMDEKKIDRCNASGVATCFPEWKGKNCTIDVDECAEQSGICMYGGECKNIAGGYRCNCLNGTRGHNCAEDINECVRSAVCKNGGTCVNTPGSYKCRCLPGYDGHCTDIDECLRNDTCKNGGTCLNTPGSYVCKCLPGSRGHNCAEDVNECSQPNMCGKGGSCVNTMFSYKCFCFPGYKGQNCLEDINECTEQTNLCQRGGQCLNTVGSYKCACPSGYSGKHCENDIDECLTFNRCVNDGVCKNTDGSSVCICPPPYVGPTCAINLNACPSSMNESKCQNGGTCVILNGAFFCDCPSQAFGKHCEHLLSAVLNKAKQSDNSKNAVIFLGVCFFIILASVVAIIILKKRAKKLSE